MAEAGDKVYSTQLQTFSAITETKYCPDIVPGSIFYEKSIVKQDSFAFRKYLCYNHTK